MPTIGVPAGELNLVTREGLQIQGQAPEVAVNLTIAVPSGSLSIASSAVSVVSGVIVGVPVDALAVSADAPTLFTAYIRGPPVGSLALAADAPTVLSGSNVQPGAGSVSLSSEAPSAEIDHTKSPGVDSLTLTGVAPSVINSGDGDAIQVPTGELYVVTRQGLEIRGQAPTVEIAELPYPSPDALILTGNAPVISRLSDPTVGSLSITGQAPSVALPNISGIQPGTGSLTFASDEGPDATPLTLTGQAPLLNWGVYPGADSLSISGQAPKVAPIPDSAALSLTGQAPGVLVSNPTITRIVPVGALSLDSDPVNVGSESSPSVGSLSLSSDAPAATLNTVFPSKGTLSLASSAPTVTTTTDRALIAVVSRFGPETLYTQADIQSVSYVQSSMSGIIYKVVRLKDGSVYYSSAMSGTIYVSTDFNIGGTA